MKDFEKLERFTLGENDDCGYDFDFDPITRWGKYTRRYPRLFKHGDALNLRDLSFGWRLARLGIAFAVLGVLAMLLAPIWYPFGDDYPDKVYWMRVVYHYVVVFYPFYVLIQTCLRMNCPYVITELAPGKPLVMHFNQKHSLCILLCVIVWLFLVCYLVGSRYEAIPEEWVPEFLQY